MNHATRHSMTPEVLHKRFFAHDKGDNSLDKIKAAESGRHFLRKKRRNLENIRGLTDSPRENRALAIVSAICRGGLYALPLRAGINPTPYGKGGRNDDQGRKSLIGERKKMGRILRMDRSTLNIYSSKAPYLRKMSSFVIFSGTPRGFVTVLPLRIRISKR